MENWVLFDVFVSVNHKLFVLDFNRNNLELYFAKSRIQNFNFPLVKVHGCFWFYIFLAKWNDFINC